jgi:hypothetical protein
MIIYDMKSFLEDCVAKYQELAGNKGEKLQKVDTPFIDESPLKDEDHETTDKSATLQPIASKVLMKILYAARYARYDLLRPTSALAQKVSKWTPTCDKMLHRLVSYINSTLEVKQVGYVGDNLSELNLQLFADADFAGCIDTNKSTSGIFMKLVGPNTSFPQGAASNRQKCVSHSTSEAEIAAADQAVRTEGLPAMTLWDVLKGKPVNLRFMEDNTATIRIIEQGRSQALRYLARTHRVHIAWLKEVFQGRNMTIEYVDTKEQAADMFTKSTHTKDAWSRLMKLIGHFPLFGF